MNFTEEQIRKKLADILMKKWYDEDKKEDKMYNHFFDFALKLKIDKMMEEKEDYYKQAISLLEKEGR